MLKFCSSRIIISIFYYRRQAHDCPSPMITFTQPPSIWNVQEFVTHFTQWYVLGRVRTIRASTDTIMGGTLHPRLNMQTISNTPTCALSHFYDWWIRRNVSMIDSWDHCYHCLLVGEGVRRHLSLVASTAPLDVGREAGIRLQSPSSHPSNPLSYPGSYGALRGGRPGAQARPAPLGG